MKKREFISTIFLCYLVFIIIYSIITGIGTLIADIIQGPIPNYLKYSYKNTEVAEIYQKECVPEVQEYIQTSDLPDVTIKVDRCIYTEYNKTFCMPVYELNFAYSSHAVDDYYESAIDSKRGAKDLFYKIREVNENKNHYYEIHSKPYRYGELFQSDARMVLFQEDDSFVMKLSGDKHKYMIENQDDYDRLTIDDEIVYELKKPEPSDYSYTPSKPKKEYNSYGSSGSSSTYNDGYNSAIDDGDYDHDRYRNDPSYRQGVDDSFDETDEDY